MVSEAGQIRFRCSLFGKLIPQISYRASNTYYDDFYFQESIYWRDLTVEDMKTISSSECFRYRRSFFGKLILQVKEIDWKWRDATIMDLQNSRFAEVIK